jgi:hypothetical protein
MDWYKKSFAFRSGISTDSPTPYTPEPGRTQDFPEGTTRWQRIKMRQIYDEKSAAASGQRPFGKRRDPSDRLEDSKPTKDQPKYPRPKLKEPTKGLGPGLMIRSSKQANDLINNIKQQHILVIKPK